MKDIGSSLGHRAIFSKNIQRVLKILRGKDVSLHRWLHREIEKVLRNPEIGKPLRYDLKNHRRVHVGSFVLVYEFTLVPFSDMV